MVRVLFVFIDGVGLGEPASHNPFAAGAFPAFEALAGGQPWTAQAQPLDQRPHVFHSIDANLGVEGLPQSGTGQATLFTGVNCAQAAGRHFGPFPHSKTKPIIAAKNIFTRVKELALEEPEPTAFANAYPPRFFSYAERRDRWTVTTRCCMDAGVPVRSLEELRRGKALAADLTGRGWRELGLDVEPISEEEAGARLHALSQNYRFTLFEYFLTDKAGHSRDARRAATVLRALDHFLGRLFDDIDSETLLIVTSDHGNLEDLSTKSHTRNPVPLVAYGRGAHHFRDARSITDVTPAVLCALSEAM